MESSISVIKMDSKTKTLVTYSRGSCVCDIQMNRHTQDKHAGLQVKERIVGAMLLTQFVNTLGNSSNNNIEQCGDKDNQGTKDDTHSCGK